MLNQSILGTVDRTHASFNPPCLGLYEDTEQFQTWSMWSDLASLPSEIDDELLGSRPRSWHSKRAGPAILSHRPGVRARALSGAPDYVVSYSS